MLALRRSHEERRDLIDPHRSSGKRGGGLSPNPNHNEVLKEAVETPRGPEGDVRPLVFPGGVLGLGFEESGRTLPGAVHSWE